jgi:hypothetical protein
MQDTWSMAAFDGVNNLLRVLSVPSTGFYMLYAPRSERQWVLLSNPREFDELSDEGMERLKQIYADRYQAEAFASFSRGTARSMYSRYDSKGGAGYQWRIEELGHTLDQIGALFSTLYSGVDFLGTDFVADQNRYYIPYNLVFHDEMNRVFGSVWTAEQRDGDVAGLGTAAQVYPTAYMEPGATNLKGKISYQVQVKGSDYIQDFDYPKADDLTDKEAAAPMNISVTYTSRIYSLLIGMVGFDVNYDLDFAKSNQVIRLGGSEEFTVPAGYEKVEVSDSSTGYRYAALKPLGGADTPAVTMVRAALDFQYKSQDPQYNAADQDYYNVIFKDRVGYLDLMRNYYSVFGKAF